MGRGTIQAGAKSFCAKTPFQGRATLYQVHSKVHLKVHQVAHPTFQQPDSPKYKRLQREPGQESTVILTLL
jgi:hypothetical protein